MARMSSSSASRRARAEGSSRWSRKHNFEGSADRGMADSIGVRGSSLGTGAESMWSLKNKWIAVAALALTLASGVAAAQSGSVSPYEVSVLGGLQVLNENDTAVPDAFVNVPLVGSVLYRFSPTWAAEGEFTWMIPVEQNVSMGSGASRDMKSPDVLAYQAGVRASFPLASWTPYLAGGVGAVTFLSNTDANRVPALKDSQTAFALNFGGGATVPLAGPWGLRGDARALVAFPASDTPGLSTGGTADPIWMERLTVGV